MSRPERVSFRVFIGVEIACFILLVQSLGDVPRCQPPAFVAAELGDFGQGVFVLVRLDPEAGETGADVFGKLLRE